MKKSLFLVAAACGMFALQRGLAVTVTTLDDSGPGSLRAAIAAGGSIDFAVTGTITLTSGELVVEAAATINGPGANQLKIQRSVAADTPEFRIFHIVRPNTVTISGLTINNGLVGVTYANGAGILNEGSLTLNECAIVGNRSTGEYSRGTGLFNENDASLTVNRCSFIENRAAGYYGEGGGLYVFGNVAVTDSTFRGNSVHDRGAGIHVDYFGSARIERCTLSGNAVEGPNAQGGGIYNYGSLVLINSTLTGNSSSDSGGGIHIDALSRSNTIRSCTISGNNAGSGGGIYANGFGDSLPPISIRNSILAGNSSPDIQNSSVITSLGNNLFGTVSGNAITPTSGDQFGVTTAALRIGALANNGGPTLTRALLGGSPAIDHGGETEFPATDQRGVARPFGPRADIGAYELNEVLSNQPPSIHITNPLDGQSFAAGANITICAEAGDSDGYVAAAQFFAGDMSLGILSNPAGGPVNQFCLIWSNVPPGNYVLKAKATDDKGAMSFSVPANITVRSNSDLPVVTVRATDAEASEPGLNTGMFTLTRDGGTNETLNVYCHFAGTASNGVDYAELGTLANIPAGSRSTTVLVRPLDDALVEGTESVLLQLVPPPTANPPTYVIGSPSNATVYIYDNDVSSNKPPVVRILTPSNGAVFTAPVNVNICASAEDADGYVWTVEFFAGDHSLGVRTNCLPCANPINPFCIVWSNAPPGSYVLRAKATDDKGAMALSDPVTITVRDGSSLPVVTVHATDAEASEPGINTGTFTLTRDGNTNNALNVYCRLFGTASNGVDYAELGNWVNIPVGLRTANVVVKPLDDTLVEDRETIVLVLVPSPLDMPTTYEIGNPSNATVYIYDNDPTLTNTPPTVRIVTPTNGQMFVAPVNIGICADARDTNGYVNTVEFFAGDHSLGVRTNCLVCAGPQNPFCIIWSNAPPGSYVLRAKATDNDGAMTLSESVNITVKSPDSNQPPVASIVNPTDGASFIAPANILVHALVQDFDGLAWAAKVEFFQGDHSIGFGLLTDPGPEHEAVFRFYWTNVPPGEYVLSAKATDDHGATSFSDRVRITVKSSEPTNHPPIVNFYSPANNQIFTAPTDIRLVAYAEDQEDGVEVKVEFFRGDQSLGFGTFVPSLCPSPYCPYFTLTWSNVPPGEYNLTAKVTDKSGLMTASPPVHMVVRSESALPVVTVRATDSEASEPGLNTGRFTLTRDGNTNNSLNVYCQFFGTASNGVDYSELGHWVNIPAGVRAASVLVTPKDDTLVEDRETVVLVLTPSPLDAPTTYDIGSPSNATVYIYDNDPVPTNAPPTVRILTPTNNQTFVAPVNINICADARDTNGVVQTVEFFAGEHSLGVRTNCPACPGAQNPFCIIWSNAPPASYVLRAKATDDQGAMTLSEPINITVKSPETNHPPFVNFYSPAEGQSFIAPANIELIAYAQDAEDAYELTVEFFAGDRSLGFGTFVPTRCATPYCPYFALTWSNVPPGEYTLTAKVTDRNGLMTTSAPKYIRVSAESTLPTVTVQATDAHAPEPGVLTVIDQGVFTIYRSHGTNDPLEVHYTIGGTASNGVDYSTLPNVAVIPAGSYSTRVIVNPLHDTLPEDTETVVLRLDEPVCITIYPPPPGCYRVGTPREAVVFIEDNDRETNTRPKVVMTAPTNGAAFMAPANIGIVTDTADADGYVTKVEFFVGDHKIGEQSKLFFTPPTNGSHIAYEFVWTNVPPGLFSLSAKATDNLGAIGWSEPVRISVMGTNTPPPTNLPPVVTITAPDSLAAEGTNCWWQTNSNGTVTDGCRTNTATFLVRRSGSTNAALAVAYSIHGTASNGVDYVELPGVITMPAGERSRRITVTPLDDTEVECYETVILRLLSPTNDPPPYVVGWPGKAAAVIVDNDSPPPGTTLLCDGTFHLCVPATNGFTYRLEASLDMSHWVPVQTNVVTEIGVLFPDAETQDFPQRFYRVIPEATAP